MNSELGLTLSEFIEILKTFPPKAIVRVSNTFRYFEVTFFGQKQQSLTETSKDQPWNAICLKDSSEENNVTKLIEALLPLLKDHQKDNVCIFRNETGPYAKLISKDISCNITFNTLNLCWYESYLNPYFMLNERNLASFSTLKLSPDDVAHWFKNNNEGKYPKIELIVIEDRWISRFDIEKYYPVLNDAPKSIWLPLFKIHKYESLEIYESKLNKVEMEQNFGAKKHQESIKSLIDSLSK